MHGLLKAKEAAALCGCHKDTIIKAVHRGAIRGWQAGKSVLVKEEDLWAWFESKRIRPEAINPRLECGRAVGGAR